MSLFHCGIYWIKIFSTWPAINFVCYYDEDDDDAIPTDDLVVESFNYVIAITSNLNYVAT